MSAIQTADLIAVILAGGRGTRIQHLVPDLPKPMVTVAGQPFLEWVVRYLARQGVRRVVISSGYKADAIESHFRSGPVPSMTVTCATEHEPMGTGGGFLFAARACGEHPAAWLVLNGDSLTFANLASVAALLDGVATAGVIVGREVSDASRYGTMVITPEGRLTRFSEKRPGRGVINAGIYLLQDALLDEFPKRQPLSFELDVFPDLLELGYRFQVCVTRAPFLDVGTPETLGQAEGFIRVNLAEFAE